MTEKGIRHQVIWIPAEQTDPLFLGQTDPSYPIALVEQQPVTK